MILISHRGNIDGKISALENQPSYLTLAFSAGYNVETDVWYKDGQFSLGHDQPTYPISAEFLQQDGIWCHAKNADALKAMLDRDVHCFWHQDDDYTLTSKGFIWTFPGKSLNTKSICVHPKSLLLPDVAGVCADNIGEFNDDQTTDT